MPVKKTARPVEKSVEKSVEKPVEKPKGHVDPPLNVRQAAIYVNMTVAEFEASGLDADTVVANKGHVVSGGGKNTLVTKSG